MINEDIDLKSIKQWKEIVESQDLDYSDIYYRSNLFLVE